MQLYINATYRYVYAIAFGNLNWNSILSWVMANRQQSSIRRNVMSTFFRAVILIQLKEWICLTTFIIVYHEIGTHQPVMPVNIISKKNDQRFNGITQVSLPSHQNGNDEAFLATQRMQIERIVYSICILFSHSPCCVVYFYSLVHFSSFTMSFSLICDAICFLLLLLVFFCMHIIMTITATFYVEWKWKKNSATTTTQAGRQAEKHISSSV